ncbi:MAG: 4Fe-4S ferredoxin [Acidobacteria bacterium]|nr:MAG: 4Fe-4S ferredoxin [Acidobacteriota bacterium]
MQIDQQKCVACGNCVPVCPMGAISIDPVRNRANVHADECVECYTCYRGMSMEKLNPTFVRTIRGLLRMFRLRFDPEPDVCPTSAITPDELTWPRVVRRAFSDPQVTHESTGVHGDVTNRVGLGEVGYVVEFGRPTVGVRFRDIEKMTRALAAIGIEFESRNPVTHLMTDTKTGKLRDDILDEKILSAIVEFKTRIENVPAVLQKVDAISKTLDTVVAVGVSTRCAEDGSSALDPVLVEEGFSFVRGKTNLGLGQSD